MFARITTRCTNALARRSRAPVSLSFTQSQRLFTSSSLNCTATPSDKGLTYEPDQLKDPQYEMKTPEEYIADVPVIEVDGPLAICDGHEDPALGHPREWLQLNKSDANEPETCKYCGLRYKMKAH